MGFVFDRTVALCITVGANALIERHLGSALRAGEVPQTVGVESQVQQDADIDVAVHIITLLSDKPLERRFGHTTPRLNTARLRAQAGTPEGLVGVSGRILKCKLVHMKAGSILLNPSNRKTRIHIVRYVLSYLNGYKDTYPKI